MTYSIEGNMLLFTVNRIQIIDISVNDVLVVEGFPGASHTWTEHDSEFIENNPDDEIYLQIERVGDHQYKSKGILLK